MEIRNACMYSHCISINMLQALQLLHRLCAGSERGARALESSLVELRYVYFYTTAVAFLHWVLQMFMISLTEWKEHLDELDDTFHWKNPHPTSGCELVLLLKIGKNHVEEQQRIFLPNLTIWFAFETLQKHFEVSFKLVNAIEL